ncbi:glycoside hydrolase family 30 protein [Cytobacillus sp. IB215665]|uniref:glycoside hydrolase family 30 protein n=1 Tax=Cytobacillus sp. IB215665 TaxID=3097357 RepID=UPI002A1862EA|nr:glycoside hydrolase family 30 beta sandwich domain-containing protein [Cytobacillus sp. IB215665]MDX8366142.1 glycoside hydrolase family 30 beta sandwich domain-containing protein [Cytobacillus sp. IB215665]
MLEEKRGLFITILLTCIIVGIGVVIVSGNNILSNKKAEPAEVWVTKGDESILLERQEDLVWGKGLSKEDDDYTEILVDGKNQYQEFYGYGAAVSHSSAYNIVNSPERNEILESLFSTENGIGLSVVRVPMGSSDFVGPVFGERKHYTYNDLEDSYETDNELTNFSIEPDKEFIIPVLKQIKEINPNVKIVSVPWSAPAWMKTTHSLLGGAYLTEFNDVYANYFVKYIKAYENEGLTIDYVSVQNEPHFMHGDYPTMYMEHFEQADFVGNFLGPAFEANGIETKIMGWDHNFTDNNTRAEEDIANYGSVLLEDDYASKYISGIAFHGYEADGIKDFGKAFDKISEQFPNAELYMTEITGGGWATNFKDNLLWNMENIILGTPLHNSSMVLLWNLALDEQSGPHLGGCGNCRGVYTVDNDENIVRKEVEYYALGQVSKFVHPINDENPIRIDAKNDNSQLDVVAFMNPDQSIVVSIANKNSENDQNISIRWRGNIGEYTVPPASVVTLKWK